MTHRDPVVAGLILATSLGAWTVFQTSPVASGAAQSRVAVQAPIFQVDPFWPKPLHTTRRTLSFTLLGSL
jgi:hypothetical protein